MCHPALEHSWDFPVANTFHRRISCCVLHVGNTGDSSDPTVPTFSRVKVWNQLAGLTCFFSSLFPRVRPLTRPPHLRLNLPQPPFDFSSYYFHPLSPLFTHSWIYPVLNPLSPPCRSWMCMCCLATAFSICSFLHLSFAIHRLPLRMTPEREVDETLLGKCFHIEGRVREVGVVNWRSRGPAANRLIPRCAWAVERLANRSPYTQQRHASVCVCVSVFKRMPLHVHVDQDRGPSAEPGGGLHTFRRIEAEQRKQKTNPA